MMLDQVQSIVFLLVNLLLVVVLIRILAVVHKQAGRVHELETRMKAMENMDVDDDAVINEMKEK